VKRLASRIVFVLGAAALLLAMTIDFVGVVGRMVGWSPLGLVEMVQFCVVGAISAALIIATVLDAHAAVHVVIERLPGGVAALLLRFSDLLGAALFAVLALGSGWMLADTWSLDERTDVLNLPLAPARIVWTAALVIVALLFVARAIGKPRALHAPTPEETAATTSDAG
jgi:TRAP-type C4-dicarboxylate transport system permease small subunit